MTNELGDQALMLSNEVERLLAELTEKRVAKRINGQETAILRAGHRSEPCTILDLSTDGACIKPAAPLPSGQTFDLVLSDGVTIEARIVWSANGQCGLSFVAGKLAERHLESRQTADRSQAA